MKTDFLRVVTLSPHGGHIYSKDTLKKDQEMWAEKFSTNCLGNNLVRKMHEKTKVGCNMSSPEKNYLTVCTQVSQSLTGIS